MGGFPFGTHEGDSGNTQVSETLETINGMDGRDVELHGLSLFCRYPWINTSKTPIHKGNSGVTLVD